MVSSVGFPGAGRLPDSSPRAMLFSVCSEGGSMMDLPCGLLRFVFLFQIHDSFRKKELTFPDHPFDQVFQRLERAGFLHAPQAGRADAGQDPDRFTGRELAAEQGR